MAKDTNTEIKTAAELIRILPESAVDSRGDCGRELFPGGRPIRRAVAGARQLLGDSETLRWRQIARHAANLEPRTIYQTSSQPRELRSRR